MKHILLTLYAATILFSCQNKHQQIVKVAFVDSLINSYTTPQSIKNNEADMLFWKNRILPNTVDYSNTLKYAGTLMSRFHLLGDIKDVLLADSLLQKTAADYNGKEAGPYFGLVSHYILQHRFKDADSIFEKAKAIGIKKYETEAVSFDINFELGRILFAKQNLKGIQIENDYGYQFRKSKMMHYNGELDSSITAMQKAVANAGQDMPLKLAALSNVGDLYIHAAKLDKAYDCFVECIKANTADMHSMMGIGWIALVKDKNDSLAEKIFQFMAGKTKSPDPIFKLVAVAEQRNDTTLELKYAKEFEAKATDTLNGNMYNKYLVQLYTGILSDPAKAEAIAKKELDTRATPQTYAWYAWALLCNKKATDAYKVYEKNISGKPLEGLELYWMGKLMQHFNKGYNAKQFFTAAAINLYDLNPAVQKDLKQSMEE